MSDKVKDPECHPVPPYGPTLWGSQEFFKPSYGTYEDNGGVVASEPHDGKLLQELFDKGLLWAINHGVLHSRGYALGAKTDDDGKIEELMIVKISPNDPDGEIMFELETGMGGYTKFLKGEHERFANRAAEAYADLLAVELDIEFDEREDIGT